MYLSIFFKSSCRGCSCCHSHFCHCLLSLCRLKACSNSIIINIHQSFFSLFCFLVLSVYLCFTASPCASGSPSFGAVLLPEKFHNFIPSWYKYSGFIFSPSLCLFLILLEIIPCKTRNLCDTFDTCYAQLLLTAIHYLHLSLDKDEWIDISFHKRFDLLFSSLCWKHALVYLFFMSPSSCSGPDWIAFSMQSVN